MSHFLQGQTAFSRRHLLQVGGLSMLGLGLPELLWANAQPTAARGRTEKSCIFIVQSGGLSHIDSWDLKPEAPEGIRGPYQPIATRTPGMRICELMPRLARLSDRYCLIRSLTHGNASHHPAMQICMTGHSRPTADTPYFGSILSKVRPSTRSPLSYVWLMSLIGEAGMGNRWLTGGFLGTAHAPIAIGNQREHPGQPDFRVRCFDRTAEITPDRLAGRQQLLARLQATESRVEPAVRFQRYQERAFDLVTRADAQRAFDLAQEADKLRDHYGRGPLGQNLLLARRLIEAGVRLVTVSAWAGFPPGEKFRGRLCEEGTWDMHGGVSSIFSNSYQGLGWALPCLDQAVAALLEDLEDRGLLSTTLVVLVGEFGRTPRLSTPGGRGHVGRDHWPQCYSAMLAGGGIRGGVLWGASDKLGAFVKDRPVSPEDFGATLLHALGVAPETRLSPDGFTRPASPGMPIEELFCQPP